MEIQQPVHGLLANRRWKLPSKILHCDLKARPGYNSCFAHEYEEDDDVFTEKINLLCDLIQQSRKMIAYTGAGISTSSGISDYASRSAGDSSRVNELRKCADIKNPYAAKPTLAHKCLTALHHAGHLKWWCQQNHDGLPQKAGMPQHAMNEIHGSWWDPSNPVVPMAGSLKSDLFDDLLQWESTADLCVAVGTSLAGMNADRLVQSCAERAKKSGFYGGRSGGSVIIGFQCTSLDHVASLRIYSSIDRVMVALAEKMSLDLSFSDPSHRPVLFRPWATAADDSYNPEDAKEVTQEYEENTSFPIIFPSGSVMHQDLFKIHGYDSMTGEKADEAAELILDLREDSRVRIVNGPHKGAIGTVTKKTANGNYQVLFQVPLTPRKEEITGEGSSDLEATSTQPKRFSTVPWRTRLGVWNIEAALQGRARYLPVVNVS